jgi:ribosomal protein L11 methylase PrmA
MLEDNRVAGSFRDPSGHVHDLNGRILRTITDHAAAEYEALRDSGVLQSLTDQGWLIASREVGRDALGSPDDAVRHVVEHPRIPHVSFPYEWPFSLLRDAALHHLDLHMAALDEGATLSDASAYNIQFRGPKPVFIDLLSLRRYREGEYWAAHRQFCEQFLNPLLLRALLGVAHNGWFRGTLEGIPTTEFARLLPLRRNLSWNVLVHVTLQARLQRGAVSEGGARAARMTRNRPLSRTAYRAMLTQLRNWIAGLHPADAGRTEWGDYAESNTYSGDEEQAKRRFVGAFIAAERPATVWDLGCNTGEYSEVALTSGAGRVIGFDADQTALERACHRARSQGLDLLPLYLDAANPSPNQGWMQSERPGLAARTNADALIALAFEHHLAIGRNIPLAQVVRWLTSLAPTGVIEFVEKSDPTIQRMLALREDIFPAYTAAEFEAELGRNARIVKSETISASGRRLYLYDRGA